MCRCIPVAYMCIFHVYIMFIFHGEVPRYFMLVFISSYRTFCRLYPLPLHFIFTFFILRPVQLMDDRSISQSDLLTCFSMPILLQFDSNLASAINCFPFGYYRPLDRDFWTIRYSLVQTFVWLLAVWLPFPFWSKITHSLCRGHVSSLFNCLLLFSVAMHTCCDTTMQFHFFNERLYRYLDLQESSGW